MKKPEPTPKKSENYHESLVEIFSNPEIIQKLTSIEREYLYWEKFKYKVSHINANPIGLWHFMKFQRKHQSKPFSLNVDLQGFDFTFNTSDDIARLLHTFDLNLGGNFYSDGIIPTDEKERYLISSIMEEAIASSQLEGAATTREEAKEMLLARRKPVNQSEKMILNNYVTIKRILELKNKPFSEELLLEIHATITKDTLQNNEYEGRYRNNNEVNVVDNITGEVFYSPPSHEYLQKLMKNLFEFANSDSNEPFIHPIIKGIILHFLIGYIHPFVDGNGRTARALFYWYVISKGYWLFEYISISRILIKSPSQYARSYLYTEYDENDLTYFIDYNLKSINLGFESLKIYITKKIAEKKQLYTIVKNEAVNTRQAEVLKEFIVDRQKTLTIKEVETKYNVVYQTARTDILGLVDLGYLTSKLNGKTLTFFPSAGFETLIKKLI